MTINKKLSYLFFVVFIVLVAIQIICAFEGVLGLTLMILAGLSLMAAIILGKHIKMVLEVFFDFLTSFLFEL